MHGRVKVRTSAEEALRKKKEQEMKAKAYRIGTEKIFSLRASQNYGQDLMELTSKILFVNPDVLTLWNIRRECILAMMEETKDSPYFEKDLGFTESCLMVQPKSYGAWHHRMWILENSSCPDWNKELKLCSLYLKKDERNFHCWDYRKYVVRKANIPADQEFKFCSEKIEKNFSNYSSWFYRSQLLPVLHPHPTDKARPISEEKLKEELELVITAAFTDPNDSSAWFYQRWLLGYSEPELNLAAFKLTNSKAIISFTKAINFISEKYNLKTDLLPAGVSSSWRSVSGQNYDTIWMLDGNFNVPESYTGKVLLEISDSKEMHELDISKSKDSVIGIKMPKFGYEFGAAVMDVLKSQLESCQQLLEYEPDSKWTLLTACLLMRSIDRFGYHTEALNYLKKLEKVDNLRAGYYKDLASKWSVEVKLKEWIELKGFLNGSINLSELELTFLYYQEYLIAADEIDLRKNRFLSGEFRNFAACDVKHLV